MEIKLIVVPDKLIIEKNANFRNEIDDALKANIKNIILDFANCDFIDSAGLGILVSSYKKAMELQGDLKLAAIRNPKVFKVFQLTRLDQVFDIFDSVEEARQGFENE